MKSKVLLLALALLTLLNFTILARNEILDALTANNIVVTNELLIQDPNSKNFIKLGFSETEKSPVITMASKHGLIVIAIYNDESKVAIGRNNKSTGERLKGSSVKISAKDSFSFSSVSLSHDGMETGDVIISYDTLTGAGITLGDKQYR